MSCQKLLRQMIGLTLITLLLVGCGAPTATPTPIAIVVTATLQATPTPVLATVTPTPVLLTSTPTPVPPTRTLVPPTVTPTIGASRMNEPAEGNEWVVTVVSAINKGTGFTEEGIGQTQTFTAPEPNTHFIEVQVGIKNLTGTDIGQSYILDGIEVRDGAGNIYPWIAAGPVPGNYYDRSRQGEGQEIFSLVGSETTILIPSYIFVVPDDVTVLYFVWPDLTPVLLEIE